MATDPCVLLVEDSTADALIAERALRVAGARAVERCTTLASALERLDDPSREPPVAVLLDLTLPDSSGAETFDRVAAVDPPPVVVLSGDDDEERALALIERGAQDYLVKGEISSTAIARSVRQAVERARLREQLRQARDQALASVRAQRAFVAALSHEVRTPLNAILGMAELLALTSLDAGQREYVEITRRCGRALATLLDNALELSRFEEGRVELAHQPFELDALVYECLETFALAAHEKGVALVADLAPDAAGTVRGDEVRLHQLVINLLGNALKFTDEGRVVVRLRRAGEGIALEVADTGLGIPRDRQAAIFERFVQAESGTTRRYGGSGLGLALCREIALAMRGEIAVESELGAGSTFRVTLPLRVVARPVSDRLAGQRILVALPDSAERGVAAARLRGAGARATPVATLAAAEARLGAERFDALLVDARLPDGGGLELLGRVERAGRAPARRVVLLPISHRSGDRARCHAAGAVALGKPVRWEVLERLLGGERVEAGGPPAPAAPPRLAGRRVLLAEDAPENRALALVHLRATGARVETAADGDEAFARWSAEPFDLVLMDLHMPGADGVEATQRIRAVERETGRRTTPIVALTADTLPEQRAECLEVGCDAHLGKPFTRDALYAVLRRFLG